MPDRGPGWSAKDEEDRLQAEVEARVRDIQRAIARGEPVAEWRARRGEVDDLQRRIQELRSGRLGLQA